MVVFWDDAMRSVVETDTSQSPDDEDKHLWNVMSVSTRLHGVIC
jgi:hypothetical protein